MTTVQSTPPLAFHKVEPGFSYSVTNYSPQKLQSLLSYLKSRDFVPALMFDDAYESFLDYAGPILAEFDLRATVFAPVAWLGKVNSWDYSAKFKPVRHLSATQLRDISKLGVNVQSHGYSHLDLTRLTQAELESELIKSKTELENLLGVAVREICYPFGRYNTRVEAAAIKAGYNRGWSLNPHDCREFTRGRWGIYGYDTILSVIAKLDGGPLSAIEFAKARVTNQLSRAGRFAFWTSREQ